jgi:hypothetical protein
VYFRFLLLLSGLPAFLAKLSGSSSSLIRHLGGIWNNVRARFSIFSSDKCPSNCVVCVTPSYVIVASIHSG